MIALGVGSPDMTPSEKRPPRARAAGRAEPSPAASALGERIALAADGAGAHDELATGLHVHDLLSVLGTARA